MSRGRLLPSLNYRSKGLIDVSIPNQSLRGMDEVRVYGASNLMDAFNNPIEILRTRYDVNFKSSSILSQRLSVEESSRDLTRMVFNLNDFSTAPPNPRIPTDEEVCFIRLRGKMRATQELTDFGPVVVVVPYDFFSVTAPIFTVVGTAPDINTDAVPDNLGVGAINIHLPYFSQTISVQNLDDTDNLYVSCAAGMSPTIIRPLDTLSLTGGAVPEFFLAGDGATPQFTIRTSLVNRG